MEWTNKQKNPKVVQKHLQYPTKTQLHKRKLVISVKNVNAQFIFPCFKLQTISAVASPISYI